MRIQLSDHFTTGKLLRFVAPSIVMMIFTSVYGVVDGLFVSNFVGKTAFAAVNLIFPLLMILGALGFMIGTGGSALVARTLGEGDSGRAQRYFSMLVYVTIGGGIVFSVLGLLFLRPIAVLLGAQGAMLEDCVVYGGILLAGQTMFMLQNVFQSFLITAEKPHFGLGVTVAAGLTNIILDFLFIAVFRWGVAGAALATVLAQLVSTIGCFIYAFVRYPVLRLHREDWRITLMDVKRHLARGIPLGLQFSVLAIGIIVMQGGVVKFDMRDGVMVSNAAQNGFGAANRLFNLVATPMNALGGAMTSFTAQNLGAGQYDRIRRGTLQALGMVSILAILAAGTGLLLTRGDFCYHVFLSADKVTPDAVRYGNSLLYVDFSMYLFLGFVFVVRNCVQGIGRSGFVLGAGAAELVARITVCLVLPGLFAGGAVSADAPAMAFYALCAADPMAWIAADTVLCIPFFRNILKKNYGYLRSGRA